MRLEGISSGYWTPFAKRSSGLISHCGSSPLPSVRQLGLKLLDFRMVRSNLYLTVSKTAFERTHAPADHRGFRFSMRTKIPWSAIL